MLNHATTTHAQSRPPAQPSSHRHLGGDWYESRRVALITCSLNPPLMLTIARFNWQQKKTPVAEKHNCRPNRTLYLRRARKALFGCPTPGPVAAEEEGKKKYCLQFSRVLKPITCRTMSKWLADEGEGVSVCAPPTFLLNLIWMAWMKEGSVTACSPPSPPPPTADS